jgi:hypothetical protein
LRALLADHSAWEVVSFDKEAESPVFARPSLVGPLSAAW